MPKIDGDLYGELLKLMRSLELDCHAGGVYVNSRGPRFETKAEINVFAQAGDVIGMTGAHEASACQEVGVPYAMIAIVDNYANGISSDFTFADFKKAQADNLSKVLRVIGTVVPAVAELSRKRFKELKNLHMEEASDADTVSSQSPVTVDLIVHAQ